MEGAGAGGRLVARPGGAWRVLGEAGLLGFEGGRTSLNLRLEAALDRGPREPGLAVQYRRGEAVHDLNSGAVLAAGVRGDSLLVSGWRGIGQSRFEGQPLLKAWLAVRSTFYSEGASGSFAANRQDLVSARLDWQLSRSLRLAPVFRASRFSERSPLYFSPGQDVVGLLSARLEARRRRLVASLTLEGGYERIDGRGVAPVLIQPILEWTIRPALPLRLSYSFGRSGASAFGSASYSSQRLALTMSGSF
jgi:hypothetical protein